MLMCEQVCVYMYTYMHKCVCVYALMRTHERIPGNLMKFGDARARRAGVKTRRGYVPAVIDCFPKPSFHEFLFIYGAQRDVFRADIRICVERRGNRARLYFLRWNAKEWSDFLWLQDAINNAHISLDPSLKTHYVWLILRHFCARNYNLLLFEMRNRDFSKKIIFYAT